MENTWKEESKRNNIKVDNENDMQNRIWNMGGFEKCNKM